MQVVRGVRGGAVAVAVNATVWSAMNATSWRVYAAVWVADTVACDAAVGNASWLLAAGA